MHLDGNWNWNNFNKIFKLEMKDFFCSTIRAQFLEYTCSDFFFIGWDNQLFPKNYDFEDLTFFKTFKIRMFTYDITECLMNINKAA